MSQDRTPMNEQPLPAQLVIWSFCLGMALIVLAVAARAAAWITGFSALNSVGWWS